MEIFRNRRRDNQEGEAAQPAIRLPVETDALGEPDGEANVEVISGASVQNLPLAGLQLSQARQLATSILNIDSRSVALVNGERVRSNYRLTSGDTLEFVHHAGEKGGFDGRSD